MGALVDASLDRESGDGGEERAVAVAFAEVFAPLGCARAGEFEDLERDRERLEHEGRGMNLDGREAVTCEVSGELAADPAMANVVLTERVDRVAGCCAVAG